MGEMQKKTKHNQSKRALYTHTRENKNEMKKKSKNG